MNELNLNPTKAQLDVVEALFGRNWKTAADDADGICFVLTEDSGDPFTVGEEFTAICETGQENRELWEFLRTSLDVQRNLVAEVERLRQRDARIHQELRDKRTDLLEVRGILSPSGESRKVPFPLVPAVAPAVEWLVAELDRLTERVAELEDEGADRMADRLLEETRLRSMDFRNGAAMDIEPARELAAIWVGCARAMLADAENYSETTVSWEVGLAGEAERYALIVQRVGKVTPHEARTQAEAEVERLAAQRTAALRLAEEAYSDLGAHIQEGGDRDCSAQVEASELIAALGGES